MKLNTKNAVVIRTTDHPVVKQYMDILNESFKTAGFDVIDVSADVKPNKNSLVITDSPLIAIKYMLKGYKRNCVWYQGVAPEESIMRNHSKLRFWILSLIEKWVMKKAQFMLFVSDEMKNFYEKKYKIKLDSKSAIMPCFNEHGIVESAFVEEKYSKNNFVYLGGLQPWQCFEETVKLYSEVEKRSEKQTKFYVFTKEKEEAVKILQKYGVSRYEVNFVNPDELSKYIKDIKYGFVLREDNIVNRVSTPTKFSNYISNGIIPIYSSSIRAFSKYDEMLKLGIVCDLQNFDKCIDNIVEHMNAYVDSEVIKEKCYKAFSDYYNEKLYIYEISQKIKQLDL